jgi:muramoyltetrapeptide carboxypeptidase
MIMESKIAVITPSGFVAADQIKLALEKACALGLKVVYQTPATKAESFLHGSKEQRLNELLHAESVDADAIWCTRGGIGAIELWHEYQPSFYKSAAPLIGYSDASIYHFMRFYRANRIGIHGPVFLDFIKGSRFLEAIELLIHKQAQKLVYPTLKSLNHFLKSPIKGELLPMNLISLQSIVGCFDHKFFQGKILALEDINEPPYKVFRALSHLKNAGLLTGLKALILGHFNQERPEVLNITVKLANELGIPLFDWPIFGHDEPNWPLLFGAKASINKIDDPFFTLSYDEQHDHEPIP